jgi:hexosaminidase
MTYILLRCKTAFMAVIFCCLIQNVFSQQVNIIPYPQNIAKTGGEFIITPSTKIFYDEPGNNELKVALAPLVLKLQMAAGLTLKSTRQKPRKNFIEVVLNPNIGEPENYHIKISGENIRVVAATPAGIFYAVQSLL